MFDYCDNIIIEYPELMDSCRDLFREIMYSTYDKSVVNDDYLKNGGNKKGDEIEVLLSEDIFFKLEN